MKLVLAAAMALTSATSAVAQSPGAVNDMSGVTAIKVADNSSMTVADGAGVVTAIDNKAGTVTIHHGPIAKLGWPAMIMTFKASPPSLLRGVKVGQSVTFTLMQMGGSTTLTAILPK
jgi:Cu(I)/Ag(I) efflux system protein CusF